MVENQKISSLGVPKEEFLAHIRRSLSRSEAAEPEPPYQPLVESLADLEAQATAVRQRLETERGALLDRFRRHGPTAELEPAPHD